MDDMQIAKLVMQIHANYVLIIDSKKKSNFLNGRCWRNARKFVLSYFLNLISHYPISHIFHVIAFNCGLLFIVVGKISFAQGLAKVTPDVDEKNRSLEPNVDRPFEMISLSIW
jgi:hypothetical protein